LSDGFLKNDQTVGGVGMTDGSPNDFDALETRAPGIDIARYGV